MDSGIEGLYVPSPGGAGLDIGYGKLINVTVRNLIVV